MAEAVLCLDATETCDTVNLEETTVLEEKEFLLMEILSNFGNHDSVHGLDIVDKFSLRVVFWARNWPGSNGSTFAKTWFVHLLFTLVIFSKASSDGIRGALLRISRPEKGQWSS